MNHIIAHLLEVIDASDEMKKDYKNNPENMIADMTYGYSIRNKLIDHKIKKENNMHTHCIDNDSSISSVKGQLGEQYVYNILKDHFPTRIISNEPYSTDIIIDHKYGNILIEVKNYTNPCPSSQYEKFIRDIDVHINGCIGAIYITLGNGMILPDNDCPLILPLKYKGVPIICINSTDEELFINSVNMIIMLHKSDIKINNISRQIDHIKDMSNMLGKQRYELKKYKNNTNLFIDRITNNLFETEYHIKQAINQMLNDIVIEERNIDDYRNYLFGIANKYTELIHEVYNMIYDEMMPFEYKKLKTKKIITWDNLILEMLKTTLYISVKIYGNIYVPIECEYKNKWIKFKITSNNKMIIPEMKDIISNQYNNIDWLYNI